MKRMLALVLLVFFLPAFGGGCLPAPRAGDGRVDLSVSWEAARAGMRGLDEISTVTAVLTRQSIIVTTALIIEGNTASGTVDGLYAGEWKVRVDAAMADATVIYTGQTTVMVVSGATRTATVTMQAAPGSLDITLDVGGLIDSGYTVTAGKVAIYENPATGTATYKDLTLGGRTLHGLVTNLTPKTYDARIVIPAATSPDFATEYFQFAIRPGRTTVVQFTNDALVALGITIIPEPGQVTGFSAVKNVAEQVEMSRHAVSGASGYRIYRTDIDGRFKELVVLDGGGVTTCVDTTFASAKLYDGMVKYAAAALAGEQEGLRSEAVGVAP